MSLHTQNSLHLLLYVQAHVVYAADPNLNPYGQLPDAPKIPEYATGLAARPGFGTSLSRSSPLLAPRPISRMIPSSTFGRPPARSRSRYCFLLSVLLMSTLCVLYNAALSYAAKLH